MQVAALQRPSSDAAQGIAQSVPSNRCVAKGADGRADHGAAPGGVALRSLASRCDIV